MNGRSRLLVPLLSCIPLALLVAGCTESPVAVTGIAVGSEGELDARGGGGVSVDATDPTSAEQGSTGVAVHVFGSGFEPGSEVSFLLDRKQTEDIATSSTTFVSETEVVATIDVAAAAQPELFDVKVETPRGRKGIGIELFEVTGTAPYCQLEFDLVLNDALAVHSDGGGTYASGSRRVLVFTGSNAAGFRFDTNGSQQLDSRRDKRWVRLDFGGTAWAGIVAPGDLKGADVRYSNQEPGLDLCLLQVGDSGTIGMDWPFEAADGERYGLKYGGTTFSGDVCTAPKATVTRTSQTTWDIASGATACLVYQGAILDQSVAMPFAFTITAQGAVP